MLLTVGGTPSIYAGDEQAFRGVKEDRVGGDDAVRPAFPATRTGWPRRLADLPAAPGPDRAAPAAPLAAPGPHPAGRTGQHALLLRGPRRRRQALLVALNLDDEALELTGAGVSEVRAGHAELDGDTVRIPGHGWVVLG